MKEMLVPLLSLFLLAFPFSGSSFQAEAQSPGFKVIVLTERGGLHESFVAAALDFLHTLSGREHFAITVINEANEVNDKLLADCQVFIQLNFPPYRWNDTAKAAFVKYIEVGRGGWVGFHHASLLGEFDGYPMWTWFSGFMGNIRFDNYIAETTAGKVIVEDQQHPVMRNVPSSFTVEGEEWYTFNKDPRPNVHVLARVDESSYDPPSGIKMGDHPVIWTNETVKARNVYFLMGHQASLLKNEAFRTMLANAILWAAGKNN